MFAGKVMAVFYSLFYRVVLPYITIIASIRKTHRLVLIIFNESAALFMTNKV
jgi:hypothetical protein